ncbi:MAG: hypothetical protein JXL80_10855, partial [Planctomycetes bacterium]|nr:hypothetical protein [Planctomycetota bacterium]
LSGVKYLGYLAFPIQMVRHYPILARLMAGRWAGGAVGFVPVFGEHGALLEHGVLDLCFNEPISIRRRVAEGKDSVLRLVGKTLLALQWLAALVAATIMLVLLKPAEGAASLTFQDMTPIFAISGLGLLALVLWMALAPTFTRVRRRWWAMVALSLVPAAVTVALHWELVRAVW